jgi:hypothetical protein
VLSRKKQSANLECFGILAFQLFRTSGLAELAPLQTNRGLSGCLSSVFCLLSSVFCLLSSVFCLLTSDRSPLRRRCGRRRSVDGMTDAAAIDPVILVGLLLSVISFVGGLIEWIAMRRVPHPIAARRGRRARGGVAGNQRLARRGRGRRCRRSCGLRRRRLLSYGRRGGFYAADLINSIMK